MKSRDQNECVAEGKSMIFISKHTTKQVPTQEKLYLSPQHKQAAFLQTRDQSEK